MRYALIAVLVLGSIGSANATTWTCDGTLTGSPTSCQTVVNALTTLPGDTVFIGNSPGTFSWGSPGLSVAKNITIAGYSMFDPSSTTIQNAAGYTGTLIDYDTQGGTYGESDDTAIVRDLKLVMPNPANGGNAPLRVHGISRATIRGSPAKLKGGVRITSVQIFGQNFSGQGSPMAFFDYVTGVVDRCWFNYPLTILAPGHGIEMAHGSGVGKRSGETQLISGVTVNFRHGLASNSYAYQFGHDPGSSTAGGHPEDPTTDALYFEDNLFSKRGIGMDMTDGVISPSSQISGGARVVLRHNTTQGGWGEHGFSESGNHTGAAFVEFYNNFIHPNTASDNPTKLNGRSGALIAFDNRFMDCGTNQVTPIFNFQITRGQCITEREGIGEPDGTNFYDLNARDATLCVDSNGDWRSGCVAGTNSFTAETPHTAAQIADARIGYTYGHATYTGATQSSTIVKVAQSELDGTNNRLVGFHLRNESLAFSVGNSEDKGAQINPGNSNIACAYITGSSGDGTTTTINLSGFHENTPQFNVRTGDVLQIRYVKRVFGLTGTGVIPMHNGTFVNDQAAGAPGAGRFVTPSGGNNVYWTDPPRQGAWAWDNWYIVGTAGTWTTSTLAKGGSGPTTRMIPGDKHDAIRTFAGRGDANGITEDYPTKSGSEYLRVGADPAFWDVNGPGGSFGFAINPPAGKDPVQGYGAVYPHPLVSGTLPSPTPTPTGTPSPTPTATATATFTPTPTATATATFTPTPTPSATPTASPSATATFTPTPTFTPTATATATFTPTPTATATATATATPTSTPPPTPTATAAAPHGAIRPHKKVKSGGI